MTGIVSRMRKLRALLAVKLGPGAAVLPPEVKRIHMDFAFNIHDGHYGPRKFWRNCLPRLKYHNPAVVMTVNRTDNQTGPAVMTVHFESPNQGATSQSDTPSTPPATGSKAASSKDRIATIDMKNRQESEILNELLKLTKAKEVKATADDLRQIRELEEINAQIAKDATLMAEIREKKKREQAILDQARASVDAL